MFPVAPPSGYTMAWTTTCWFMQSWSPLTARETTLFPLAILQLPLNQEAIRRLWKKDSDALPIARNMQYDHLVLVIFSYSILLAAVIGYFRYSKIPAGDRPFLFLIWIGLINEIVSEMTTAVFKNTAFNSNIYVLIESLLYCQLFLNWGSFKRNLNLFWATIVFLVVTWIYDNLFAHSIAHI